VIAADVADLLEAGNVAIWLAVASSECVPQTTRAMGARADRERSTVVLFVPVVQGARALAHIHDGSQIAITFCRILDYRAVQVKGVIGSIRPCTDDDRAIIERYHAAFTIASSQVGIPTDATTRLASWPSVALEVSVRELYSQTPGANAGARL
jgi:hypothetical protein